MNYGLSKRDTLTVRMAENGFTIEAESSPALESKRFVVSTPDGLGDLMTQLADEMLASRQNEVRSTTEPPHERGNK